MPQSRLSAHNRYGDLPNHPEFNRTERMRKLMSGGRGSLRKEHAMPTMPIELPAVAMRSALIPPTAGPRSKDRDASPVEGHPPSPHHTCYRCTHGDTLTARERAVLRMIGRGFCNKRIARALKISPETVKSHVKHILLKMAVNTRAEAVYRAASFGRDDSSKPNHKEPATSSVRIVILRQVVAPGAPT